MARATDWHVLDLATDPVPGDPWRVKELGGRLRDLADDAENAARNVRGLSGDHAAMNWIGAAGDAFKEHIGKFPGQLDKVANSHHMCADALFAYASDLDTAQSEADRALVQARPLFDKVQSLHSQLATANADATSTSKSYTTLTSGSTAPDSTALAAAVRAKSDSQHTVDTLNSQLSGPEAQLEALKKLAHQAAGLRDTAENTAERKIHEATDAGIPPDSFWHKLGDLAATLWHGLVIVAKIVSFIGAIVLMVVGGPLWLIVAVVVAGLIILADTLYKYSQGQASLWDVGLSILGCIPITKGLTSLNAIREAFQAGGILGAGLHVGGAFLGAAKDLVTGLSGLLKGGFGKLLNVGRDGLVEIMEQGRWHSPGDALPGTTEIEFGTTFTRIGNDEQTVHNTIHMANEGAHDVILHGVQEGFLMDGKIISTQAIADVIRANPHYVPGSPIRLVVCWAGNDIGPAQELADTLGATVRAANGTVGTTRTGGLGQTLQIFRTNGQPPQWRVYLPNIKSTLHTGLDWDSID